MFKRLAIFFIVVLVGMIGISKASAHTTPFKPYNATVTWYKSGGTLDNIWPQNLTVITCGGISQYDEYTITSSQLDKEYKALLAKGILNSGADDAKFNPHDWKVTLLPICQTPKPDVIQGGDSSQNCDGITTRTWHQDWTWDGTQWVALPKVYDTNEHRALTHQEALDEGCITDTPTPTDTPTTDTPSPTPTVTTDAPTPTPSVSVTTTKPEPKQTQTIDTVAKTSLANTGADTGGLLVLVIILLGLGGAVLLISRLVNVGRRKHN